MRSDCLCYCPMKTVILTGQRNHPLFLASIKNWLKSTRRSLFFYLYYVWNEMKSNIINRIYKVKALLKQIKQMNSQEKFGDIAKNFISRYLALAIQR